MHSTSAPNAMSTNAQPKFEMIHDKVADMTAPRFSGATSPHTTNAAMTNADPQNTAGSMLLKVPFMYCLSSPRGRGWLGRTMSASSGPGTSDALARASAMTVH
jgi:hypothetical protein